MADTSVWVDHLRSGNPALAKHLLENSVLMHPWVAGELACGNLKARSKILDALHALPSAQIASDTDGLRLIDDRMLWGRGLGWVDIHLLSSALLSNCRLWTLDKKLERTAYDFGLNCETL